MFAALYINIVRIHLCFFQVISSIQTQQRERKEEEKEEKKTRLLFILISKQKRIFTEDYISFKYVISCFLKWESLLKWKPSVTHYRYKNMFLRFLTNKAEFDKRQKHDYFLIKTRTF